MKQGWAKANKLEGRNTAQGLVGLLVRDGTISMVELNCETDFVSRNSQFLELLNEITRANLKEGKDKASARVNMTQQDIGALKDTKGHSLADLVALNIGQIGENLVTRRGVCLNADSGAGAKVSGVTHPSANIHTKEVQYGRYGAAMVYTVEEGGVMPSGQDASMRVISWFNLLFVT